MGPTLQEIQDIPDYHQVIQSVPPTNSLFSNGFRLSDVWY